MNQNRLNEGGHKKGCTCNFCKNLGSFGKKKSTDNEPKKKTEDKPDTDDKSEKDKEVTAESIVKRMLD